MSSQCGQLNPFQIFVLEKKITMINLLFHACFLIKELLSDSRLLDVP
jgi:hypothetical protein